MSAVKFLMRIERDFLKTDAVLGDVGGDMQFKQYMVMHLRQVRRTEILQSQSEANFDLWVKPNTNEVQRAGYRIKACNCYVNQENLTAANCRTVRSFSFFYGDIAPFPPPPFP